MEVIPCEEVKRLEGTDIFTEIEKEIRNYQGGSVIGSIIMIIALAFMLPVAVIFSQAFFSADGIIAHEAKALTSFLSPLVSDFLVGAIVLIFNILSDGILAAVLLATILVPLWYLYLGVRSATDKRSSVANALYLTEKVSEAEYLLLPPIIPSWAYEASKKFTNRTDNYPKDQKVAYSEGAIIARTPLRWQIVASGESPSNPDRVIERKGFITSIKDQGEYSVFFFGYVIAVVDKKYKERIIERIRMLNPSALK